MAIGNSAKFISSLPMRSSSDEGFHLLEGLGLFGKRVVHGFLVLKIEKQQQTLMGSTARCVVVSFSYLTSYLLPQKRSFAIRTYDEIPAQKVVSSCPEGRIVSAQRVVSFLPRRSYLPAQKVECVCPEGRMQNLRLEYPYIVRGKVA